MFLTEAAGDARIARRRGGMRLQREEARQQKLDTLLTSPPCISDVYADSKRRSGLGIRGEIFRAAAWHSRFGGPSLSHRP